MGADLNHEVLDSACQNDKKLYRRLVQEMSANLRRRPQMLLQTPRAARHALFKPLLELPRFDTLAQNLLIQWLRASQVPMMNAFLEALGIPHDANGCAGAFPGAMDADKLRGAADKLYAAFVANRVTLFLSVFDRLSGAAWPEMESCLRRPASATG